MNDEQIKAAIRQAFIAVEKGFFQSLDDALAEKTELQLQMPEVQFPGGDSRMKVTGMHINSPKGFELQILVSCRVFRTESKYFYSYSYRLG